MSRSIDPLMPSASTSDDARGKDAGGGKGGKAFAVVAPPGGSLAVKAKGVSAPAVGGVRAVPPSGPYDGLLEIQEAAGGLATPVLRR